MEKRLSIYIGLFKEIGDNFYKEPYNMIKYDQNNNITLNTITFYSNLSNKKYFLLYVLFKDSEENFKLLGDYIIKTQEELLETNSKDIQKIGFFKGTFNRINYSLKKNLEKGSYELAILGKEFKNEEEISQIREELKLTPVNIKGFEIFTSASFDVA